MTTLLRDDLSGYELAKRFETDMSFSWNASHQQIYLELKKMSAKNWLSAQSIEQTGKPNKVIYSLTDLGKETLDQWVLAPGKLQHAKDDLSVKLHNVGFTDVAPILTELNHRLESSYQRLAEYEQVRRQNFADPSNLHDKQKGVFLMLDMGIGYEKLFQKWSVNAITLLHTVKPA